MEADDIFNGIGPQELHNRKCMIPDTQKDSEFFCDECGCRCTELRSGGEAGHSKYCSRKLPKVRKPFATNYND